ncbi:MAG TPA: PilZ domain-containing protein [Chloroflexota bacterium]|nr:PilZ domain-containing protein [Chloroflexota bacterium]
MIQERRKFFRERVDLAATLYLNSSDDLRRACRIVDLGGGGGQLEISSQVGVAPEILHELHFDLPNRAGIVFSCELVAMEDRMADDVQWLHMRFVRPLPGYQDSVISYVQNRKHLEKAACKVAMPVCMDPMKAATGRGESCLGMTIEAGRTYAVAEFRKPTPPAGSDVMATFLGPRIIKETSVPATVEDVTRTLTGFRLRLAFGEPTDQVLDFARRYYAPKKRVSVLAR